MITDLHEMDLSRDHSSSWIFPRFSGDYMYRQCANSDDPGRYCMVSIHTNRATSYRALSCFRYFPDLMRTQF